MKDYRIFSSSAFVYSLDVSVHPVREWRPFIKELYYYALQYITLKCSDSIYSHERLLQYKKAWNVDGGYTNATEDLKAQLALAAIGGVYYEMQHSGIMMMMHDLYLTSPSMEIFRAAEAYLSVLLKQVGCDKMEKPLYNQWQDTMFISSQRKKLGMEQLAAQNLRNYLHQRKEQHRIIITATISAGKSTLINAIIGKRLTRTAQGVCTGNISYLYNKPFEDGKIHLIDSGFSLDAELRAVTNQDWSQPKHIASYFRSPYCDKQSVCLIDTPGVNASTHEEHGEISYHALQNEKYDVCVCVLSAKALGTVDEWHHLQWLSENIPAWKMVFVVNMLDVYHEEDDIAESLENVRMILKKFNYNNPILCPISARCALLSKRIQYGETLTEDEEDEHHRMTRKFRRKRYDLSGYYDFLGDIEEPEIKLRQRCGFEGFEKIVFGG